MSTLAHQLRFSVNIINKRNSLTVQNYLNPNISSGHGCFNSYSTLRNNTTSLSPLFFLSHRDKRKPLSFSSPLVEKNWGVSKVYAGCSLWQKSSTVGNNPCYYANNGSIVLGLTRISPYHLDKALVYKNLYQNDRFQPLSSSRKRLFVDLVKLDYWQRRRRWLSESLWKRKAKIVVAVSRLRNCKEKVRRQIQDGKIRFRKKKLHWQRELWPMRRQQLYEEYSKTKALLRQRLRLHNQYLYIILLKGRKEISSQHYFWAARRTQKLAAAFAALELQKARVTQVTMKAKNKLITLWEQYGWSAVLAYSCVHILTLVGLFALSQLISDELLHVAAQKLLLDKIFDLNTIENNGIWGRMIFAYAAAKPLTPLQIAVAIYATPPLSALLRRRGIIFLTPSQAIAIVRRHLKNWRSPPK